MKPIYRPTRKRYGTSVLCLVALLFVVSCRKADVPVPQQQSSVSQFSASIATGWMEQFRHAVTTEHITPPLASRIYAYAGIAVYEAVLPGMPQDRSLAGQVPLLQAIPTPASTSNLQYEITVNEAMYGVAKALFANAGAATLSSIDSFYNAHKSAIAANPADIQASQEFGKSVATAVANRAASDGFAETRSMTYQVPGRNLNPANWAPTGPALQPLEPFWGKIKCFAMTSSNECEQAMTCTFDSTAGSNFYNQAKEVYDVSQNLTQEQRDIALWWADGAGTATPPGHWLAIANQLANSKGLDLGRAAEMYALLNLGLADAFISCWDAKYKCNLLRPVTYIRDYIQGGSNWSSLIATPPFPEYPSGHSVASGAAAEILTAIFGNISFTDNTNKSMGLTPRSFSSFYAAADEAAISRLYGGIHYRQSIENGVIEGKKVGQSVFAHIKLR